MDFVPQYMSDLVLLLGCTAFIKIATVFSALRYGLGLGDFVFGIVTVVAAFVFAFVLPAGSALPAMQQQPFWVQVESQRSFLEKHSDREVVAKLQDIRDRSDTKEIVDTKAEKEVPEDAGISPAKEPAAVVSIQAVLAGFILNELKEAFQLALLLLIPFVVLDLLVVNLLALMGVTQISAVLISLPLKLALFVAAGGWELLVEKLLFSYGA